MESLSIDETDSTESELPPLEQNPPPHVHSAFLCCWCLDTSFGPVHYNGTGSSCNQGRMHNIVVW